MSEYDSVNSFCRNSEAQNRFNSKIENISEQQISKLAKYCINGFFDHNDIPKTMALKIISC